MWTAIVIIHLRIGHLGLKLMCALLIKIKLDIISLEAQVLSNLIDITDSLRGRLALSAIFPLFVDRF